MTCIFLRALVFCSVLVCCCVHAQDLRSVQKHFVSNSTFNASQNAPPTKYEDLDNPYFGWLRWLLLYHGFAFVLAIGGVGISIIAVVAMKSVRPKLSIYFTRRKADENRRLYVKQIHGCNDWVQNPSVYNTL